MRIETPPLAGTSCSVDALWQQILCELQGRLSAQRFQTWFSPTRPVAFRDGLLSVEVPNAFFIDWIEEHFLGMLNETVLRILGPDVRISFCVNPETSLAAEPPASPPPSAPVNVSHDGSRLQTKFTFANFIVGKSNRFACAACEAVSQKPGGAYNPLFVYGGVGLGKTHLLHAIGNRILTLMPRKRIQYLTSEKFMNELVYGIQHGRTLEFKDRYRTADVLLIDDVQFLSGKESTQEEFFHTFNSLYDGDKQIVMTSDRPPRDIPKIEDRLLSRFHWGLVTNIEPPDYETRLAILKSKTEQDGLALPGEVLEMIADSVSCNIRELEGCLARLSALSSLTGQRLDVGFAEAALKDIVRPRASSCTIAAVQRAVARHFGVTEEALRGKRRTSTVAFARQVAMYLSKQTEGLSYMEVGRRFGNRDHSTVLFAVRKMERLLESDPAVAEAISSIRVALDAEVSP